MQIHELNTFTEIPGGASFLAIDNGFDTGKISAGNFLSGTNAKIDSLENKKLNNPAIGGNPDYGDSGQLLRTLGDGRTEWADVGLPTDAQTAQAVSDWLDEHPEATTTVQDGTITEAKIEPTFLPLIKNDCVTPQMYGAKGDGINDDTVAIQNALDSGRVVFFPDGIYLVSSPLTIHNSIIGMGAPRIGGVGSVIKCGFNTEDYLINFTDSNSANGVCIDNIAFDCQSVAGGINYAPVASRPPIKITNVSVWNHGIRGINIDPVQNTSRCAMISNVSITGGTDTAECCIYFSTNAKDCSLTDFICMYCQKGVVTWGAGLRMDQGHIYVGRSNISDLDTYYEGTICVYAMSDVLASNVYMDSALQGWVQRGGVANISSFFVWYDTVFQDAVNKSATVIKAVDDDNACVEVGSIVIGGNRTLIGNLVAGNVRYGSLLLKGWTELPSSTGYSYRQTPFMIPNLGKNQYNFHRYGTTWTVVGVVYLGTTGSAILRVSRSQLAGDVVIKYDGTNETVTGHRVFDLGAIPLYYSRVGRYLYLWAYPYTEVNVRSLLSTNKGDFAESVCGVDISTMPDLTPITQADTTGLTQITFS